MDGHFWRVGSVKVFGNTHGRSDSKFYCAWISSVFYSTCRLEKAVKMSRNGARVQGNGMAPMIIKTLVRAAADKV